MELFKSISKERPINISEVDIVKAKAYEISYTQLLGRLAITKSSYMTQRAIDTELMDEDNNLVKLRYSRGSLEESKGFLEFAHLDNKLFYSMENRVIYDISNNKIYTNKEITENEDLQKKSKFLDKAYKVCFGDEIEYSNEIQDLKLKYIAKIEAEKKEIAKYNLDLKEKYIQIQDEHLSEITKEYKIFGDRSSKIVGPLRNMFNDLKVGENTYTLNITTLRNLTSNELLVWNIGYICKEKQSGNIISLTLYATTNLNLNPYREQCLLNVTSKTFKNGIKVGVHKVKGDSIKLLIMKHLYKELNSEIVIEDYIEKYIVDIEDTPEQYRNIVLKLLAHFTSRVIYKDLFGIKECDRILRRGYTNNAIECLDYLRDIRLRR